MFVLNILFVLMCTTGIHGSRKIMCDLNDVICTSRSSAKYYYYEMAGQKGLWERSDPIKQKLVEGSTSSLSFKFTDAELTGLLQCTITFLKMDPKAQTMDYEIACPRLTEAAQYQIKGYIGDLYLEGEGNSKVTRDLINLMIHTKYESYIGENGYEHIHITNYKTLYKSNGKVSYEYDQLFNGDKKRSDAAHAYMNRNTRMMEQTFGNTVMPRFMDKYIKNINDELKVVPLKDIMYYEV